MGGGQLSLKLFLLNNFSFPYFFLFFFLQFFNFFSFLCPLRPRAPGQMTRLTLVLIRRWPEYRNTVGRSREDENLEYWNWSGRTFFDFSCPSSSLSFRSVSVCDSVPQPLLYFVWPIESHRTTCPTTWLIASLLLSPTVCLQTIFSVLPLPYKAVQRSSLSSFFLFFISLASPSAFDVRSAAAATADA